MTPCDRPNICTPPCVCVPCLTHMCAMTPSEICNMTHLHLCNHSAESSFEMACILTLMCVCDMTHSDVFLDFPRYETWLIHTCATTARNPLSRSVSCSLLGCPVTSARLWHWSRPHMSHLAARVCAGAHTESTPPPRQVTQRTNIAARVCVCVCVSGCVCVRSGRGG